MAAGDHQVSVDKGDERHLAPSGPRSRRAGRCVGADVRSKIDAAGGDPALPQGAQALSGFVKAPAQLARRLGQIGVVNREAGAKLATSLKSGQRLVSREGDLWRWDGFVAAAHAPTGAARRLAQRSRHAEIDSELTSARAEVEGKRKALDKAQAAFDAASTTEAETRSRERDLNRQAARLSALAEARTAPFHQPRRGERRQGRGRARFGSTGARRQNRNANSPPCATTSRENASSSPKCAPSSRRSCARRNWPTSGSRHWPATKPAGTNAATARAPKSPRSNNASPRPSATAPSLKTRRRFSRKNEKA